MNAQVQSERKPRPLIDLAFSIIIPAIILMKLSGDDDLGPVNALLFALAFPLGQGLYELARYRKFNFISILGLVSVILTGGIGLLELDAHWLAVKEAMIPGLIGTVVVVMTYSKHPPVNMIIYNPKILQVDRIQSALEVRGQYDAFNLRLINANYFLAGTFFFSACMNFILAKLIVSSPSGTTAFNEELAHMTLLSYPMIAIPSMIMMFGIMYYLYKTVRNLTGLTLEEVFVHQQ